MSSEADIPGVTGETPHVEETGKSSRRERSSVSPGEPGSPMDFWRSGSARSARARRPTAAGATAAPTGLLNRITSMYLPPWVPVVGIIFVVFGILGVLFVVRSATGAPRIAEDHWHAPYTFWVCGEKQAPAPTWSGGVHTHGDGLIHIHPNVQGEEGQGASLENWFKYGGGLLDSDEVRLPGSSTTYKNGDECPDGTIGEIQVFSNGQKIDYDRYIPHDGDQVRIVFGPPEEQVQLDDRTIVDPAGVTREVDITVNQPDDANEASTVFSPAAITVSTGEVVKINVTNLDEVSHGLIVKGYDGEEYTKDDFVVVPDGEDPSDPAHGGILEPGESGFVIIEFNDPVREPIEFFDPTVITTTGTITIEDTQVTATPDPEEEFDQEIDVTIDDGAFDPDDISVDAGDRVRLNLANEGEFAHIMRIDGPDGLFFTEDDVKSDDILPGNTGELIINDLEAGTYKFLDDFNQETMTGTLTVE